MSDWTELPL